MLAFLVIIIILVSGFKILQDIKQKREIKKIGSLEKDSSLLDKIIELIK